MRVLALFRRFAGFEKAFDHGGTEMQDVKTNLRLSAGVGFVSASRGRRPKIGPGAGQVPSATLEPGGCCWLRRLDHDQGVSTALRAE